MVGLVCQLRVIGQKLLAGMGGEGDHHSGEEWKLDVAVEETTLRLFLGWIKFAGRRNKWPSRRGSIETSTLSILLPLNQNWNNYFGSISVTRIILTFAHLVVILDVLLPALWQLFQAQQCVSPPGCSVLCWLKGGTTGGTDPHQSLAGPHTRTGTPTPSNQGFRL